jgi:hypothetical protein
VIFEYDSLGEAVAVSEAPASDSDQSSDSDTWSFEKAYEEIGIELLHDRMQSKAEPSPWPEPCDLATLPEDQTDCTPNCVTLASLDQQIGCTKGGSSNATEWYVHGLSVPWAVQWLANDRVECASHAGLLWLAGGFCDPTSVRESPVREDFLIYDDINSETMPKSSPHEKLVTGIHEFSHVLNLHKCDHEGGLHTEGRLGSKAKTHVRAAREAAHSGENEYRHVQTGAQGLPWCEMTSKHISLHELVCCPDDSRGLSMKTGVELEMTTGKPSYCPGEPITVKFKLMVPPEVPPDQQDDVWYRKVESLDKEESLDPRYGFLTLWLSTAPGSEKPLDPPVYWEWNLDEGPQFEPLSPGESIESSVDIWYGTGIDQSTSFNITATYAGFKTPEEKVVSERVTVRIDPVSSDPEICDPFAEDLLNDPEARRVMWLLGGDHLPGGLEKLDLISRQYSRSVYAAYANLALMRHWSQVFHYVRSNGTLARRRPNIQKARDYQQRLSQDQRDVLPDFYKGVLHQTESRLRDR